MATETPSKAGLEDVVAATSSICYLDGARGVLAYRGYDIHDLAQHATFEEVCFLLWHGRLPSRAELGDLHSQLWRPVPFRRHSPSYAIAPRPTAMDAAAHTRVGGLAFRPRCQRHAPGRALSDSGPS